MRRARGDIGSWEGATRPGDGFPPALLKTNPRLLILKTGETALEVQRGHGDYDRWFTDALAPLPVACDVCDATRAPVPDLAAYAGVIVTGSVKSVLRPEPWMERLARLLRRAERTGRPFLCVCFGCQILAQARGGTVVRSPAGWEIGAVEIGLTAEGRRDPLFAGLPSPLPVLATHEDRVETLPAGAVVLAGNGACPVQALRIGGSVYGVQFHPEATADILRELLMLRRARLEEELRRRERPWEGEVDRLLAALDRFDAKPALRVLENFVGICLGRSVPEETVE